MFFYRPGCYVSLPAHIMEIKSDITTRCGCEAQAGQISGKSSWLHKGSKCNHVLGRLYKCAQKVSLFLLLNFCYQGINLHNSVLRKPGLDNLGLKQISCKSRIMYYLCNYTIARCTLIKATLIEVSHVCTLSILCRKFKNYM